MSTHTFPLHTRYHLCPNCNKIHESRSDWEYRMGKYLKDLSCSHCHHMWTEEKSGHFRLGPLFTKPQNPEFDWSSET